MAPTAKAFKQLLPEVQVKYGWGKEPVELVIRRQGRRKYIAEARTEDLVYLYDASEPHDSNHD